MKSRSVVVLVAVLVAVLGSPASAHPTTPTAVVPSGSHAAYYGSVIPLAGSASYLAYAKTTRAPDGSEDADSSAVWIRRIDGTRYRLSPVVHVEDAAAGYSLVGSIFIAETTPPRVVWYDLAAGTHGKATPPPGTRRPFVATASADGWLTVSDNGSDGFEVFDTATSGIVTSYGYPFPGSRVQPILRSGPTGVLDEAFPDISYMSYADPGSWTALSRIDGISIACPDVSATNAACLAYGGLGENVVQEPLDGSPGIITSPGCAASYPRQSATAIVWLCDADKVGVTQTHLRSVPLGGGPVNESSFTVPSNTQLRSAQGSVDLAFGSTNGPSTMSAVTAAGAEPEPLFTTSRSAVESSQLAVTTGRVLWQDDRDSRLPISVRPIERSATGQIDLGPTSQAFAAAGEFGLAASGARTIVNTHGRDIIESSPLGRVSVPFSRGLSPVDVAEQPLSGNRYLYGVSGADSVIHYMVRDLRSGKDRALRASADAHVISAAIWGDVAAYVDDRGAVWCRNLTTGRTRRLHAPLRKPRFVEALVSVYDNHVGWDIEWSGHSRLHMRAAYRNIATMAPPIALSARDAMTQMSSDGLLIQRFRNPSQVDLFHSDYAPARWELLSYDGRSRQVIAPSPAVTNVTVENGVIVYLDARQQPEAVAVEHPTRPTPVSLGDPVAPTRFADTSKHRWTTYQAFSRPLSSCAIVIRRSGTQVARLACEPQAMTTGDAFAQWNGRNSSGRRVRAGRYTWGIHASSASAPVRGRGDNVLRGTIRVSR